MRIIKFLFALIVIANSIYLLYLLWANYLLSDYFWLLQGFNELLYQLYQDPSDPVTIGAGALLIVQSGILVFLWLLSIASKWFWHVLSPLKSVKLIAKPTNMSAKLYANYKEAITIRPVSKAGSILLIRSFLEAMIHECFKQERSSFFNSVGKLKKSGRITKEEATLLYSLRKIGNFTSHQRELSSQEITNEDMDSIFGSTERLMQDWYSRKENGLALMDIERRYKPVKSRPKPSLKDETKPSETITGSSLEDDTTPSSTFSFDDNEKNQTK